MILSLQQCIFFIFSTVLIIAAFMTVISRNLIRSALFLVLAFFAAAVLWILLEAEFLGLILILIYVGAVMTLFLFVIMTLNITTKEKPAFVSYLPYAAVSIVLLLGWLIYVLEPGSSVVFSSHSSSTHVSNTQALGELLYTSYAYPFEITGVLLLVAIIASIALVPREKRLNKAIPPEKQLHIKRADRLRIIKLDAEKKL